MVKFVNNLTGRTNISMTVPAIFPRSVHAHLVFSVWLAHVPKLIVWIPFLSCEGHPNKTFTANVVQGPATGFDVGYTAPRASISSPNPS